MKKTKQSKHNPKPLPTVSLVFTNENLLYEILKHVDAKTLGVSACVSKHWHQTAQDERLWELICTQNIGCSNDQLHTIRTMVCKLGGFRCLYSCYLLPLSKPNVSIKTSSSCYTVAAASSSSVWPCVPSSPLSTVAPVKRVNIRWGEDEIQLSLSLLSVRYFRKMDFSKRNE